MVTLDVDWGYTRIQASAALEPAPPDLELMLDALSEHWAQLLNLRPPTGAEVLRFVEL